ncbi:MAG: hypothetical protein H6Q67_1077 [Firmicutes bacterium]|nr:hypothetical protein [Bacillota bacterium]
MEFENNCQSCDQKDNENKRVDFSEELSSVNRNNKNKNKKNEK